MNRESWVGKIAYWVGGREYRIPVTKIRNGKRGPRTFPNILRESDASGRKVRHVNVSYVCMGWMVRLGLVSGEWVARKREGMTFGEREKQAQA